MARLIAPSLRPSDPFLFRLKQYVEILRQEPEPHHARRVLDLAVEHTSVETLYFYLGKTQTTYGSVLKTQRFDGVKNLGKFSTVARALQIYCDEDTLTLTGLEGSLTSLKVIYEPLSTYYTLRRAKQLQEALEESQSKAWTTHVDQLARGNLWHEIQKLHQKQL